MTSIDRIHEKQADMRFAAPACGGGYVHAADFRAAFAKVCSAAGSEQAPPVGTERSTHVVTAGETLYGIARARLAAAGQAATPGASMRYALQIAQANQIRNPDRIHVGQRLDLVSAATIERRNGAENADVGSAAPDDAGISQLQELDWQPPMPGTGGPTDAGGNACDAADCPPPSSALPPAAGTVLRDDIRSQPDSVAEASVAEARAELALYRQIAPAAAKPSDELPDIVYKGVVGKALDLVPLETSTRTGLQQANAVISGSFAGRSIAALTGLGGPLLTVAGLIWGIFSAQRISATPPDMAKQVARNALGEVAQ